MYVSIVDKPGLAEAVRMHVCENGYMQDGAAVPPEYLYQPWLHEG